MDSYDESRGPERRNRTDRKPHDLARSQRIGLVRDVCTSCGAVRGDRITRHERFCDVPGTFVRQRTGPLARVEEVTEGAWEMAA